jgi:DNA-binding NtrC family response regulator
MKDSEGAVMPSPTVDPLPPARQTLTDQFYDTLAHPAQSVTVLSLSPIEEDHRRLRNIFEHSKWRLTIVSDYGAACQHMRHTITPVVIAEHDLGTTCWKDVLRQTFTIQHPSPRLIVTARLADDSLWAEVLNLGGYNVLAKPFDAREVFWVVSHAWLDWKSAYEKHLRGKAAVRDNAIARAAGA